MENKFDRNMKAKCGTYCGVSEWKLKEKTGCPGCKTCASKMFWGECNKAKCCMERGYEHCGQCPEIPCQKLLDLFADPEHVDNGARIRNLKNWASGVDIFEMLR